MFIFSYASNNFDLTCRYNPKPDGNCQFESLSDQLKYKLSADIGHADLQHAVVEHLWNDDHEGAKHFVTEPWSSYLTKMDVLGTYGDHITINVI